MLVFPLSLMSKGTCSAKIEVLDDGVSASGNSPGCRVHAEAGTCALPTRLWTFVGTANIVTLDRPGPNSSDQAMCNLQKVEEIQDSAEVSMEASGRNLCRRTSAQNFPPILSVGQMKCQAMDNEELEASGAVSTSPNCHVKWRCSRLGTSTRAINVDE